MSERSCALVSTRCQAREGRRAYATGLPLARQELQLLVVAELDHDVDCPLVVILVFADANFARAADACIAKRQLGGAGKTAWEGRTIERS